MKAKLFTAIISTSLLLSACGGHNHPKAVDKLEEAKSNAIANAPKSEEIRFDDHGQPTMGGVGGATDGAVAPTTTVEPAPSETTTETTAEPAPSEAEPSSAEPAEPMATAEAPQADATAETEQ